MDEEEMEKFEITDYDLNNEFYSGHGRKKLTKHQQIYGIWADDSDDEDARPSFQNNKQSKNYTAPIGFVAGGVQQAGKKPIKGDPDVKQEDASGSDSEKEEEEEEKPLRRGFGSSGPKVTRSTVTEITADIAGLRTKKAHSSSIKGVGHWEKHTKGIGAKLLLQMGYKPGKGLGKDLQGISAPVEAHLRKGRGAIGAYGPEKAASIAKTLDPVKGEIEVIDEDEKGKWRKKGDAKTTRYYYRSVDDVIEKGKKPFGFKNILNASELAKVKVIDMTGPQQRVLSGYHALSGLRPPAGAEHYEDVVHKKCSNFTLPEIQHNLDILVDMCEQDIIRIDRSTRNNQDRIVALKHEEETLIKTIEKEDDMIENLGDVLKIVEKLLDPSLGLSLLQVADIFYNLKNNHREEFERYELGELAPGAVGSLLTSALATWTPLVQPSRYVDVFAQWKSILDSGPNRSVAGWRTNEGNNMMMGIQPYDSLLWHTWMPVMRLCVSAWNPRDCDPLITLVETWKHVLPSWVLDNLYDQIILPKIQTEVTQWNPLIDTVPIHVWIHPWIPLLDVKLQASVYPMIQEKLGTALTNWHPSDTSAKPMLKPWQRVLPEGAFLAFMIKHIVPKLQLCMQSLVINPHQQHLDAWYWVMDWKDMLSVGNMVLILDKFFFPRWRQTLAMWLNHNPNYTEVTEWYTGWKNMLSDELLTQPTIKENFHNALEIMNRAVNIIGQQPGARESISYLASLEKDVKQPQPPPPPSMKGMSQQTQPTEVPAQFKDLVAKRCEDRGILFVPIPNKYQEAKQVYRIGGLQCYIDRNVIFSSAANSQSWAPISLTRLLDIA